MRCLYRKFLKQAWEFVPACQKTNPLFSRFISHFYIMPFDSSQLLYEDNHLLAVNKLPGQLVQGDKTGDAPLGDFLKEYLKAKYGKPGEVFLGVVHRLDRPVSGVVLFARTS